MNLADPVTTAPAPDSDKLFAPGRSAACVGAVALISMLAFEAIAVATAMPAVAEALNGLPLYALAFGATLATSVIGMAVAGQLCDKRGPYRASLLGLAAFLAGRVLAAGASRDVYTLFFLPKVYLAFVVFGLGAAVFPALAWAGAALRTGRRRGYGIFYALGAAALFLRWLLSTRAAGAAFPAISVGSCAVIAVVATLPVVVRANLDARLGSAASKLTSG